MAVLTVDGALVSPVEIYKQWSAPGAGAIPAGKAVYRDATTGYATLCPGGATVPEGISITTTSGAKQTVTAVQQGRIDLGGTVLAAVPFGTVLYSHTGGALETAPSDGDAQAIGTVTPVFSRESSNALAPDHLLDVNL
ncbi:MAG: hypothetical protein WCG26_01095 [Chloroflexales bacterium]